MLEELTLVYRCPDCGGELTLHVDEMLRTDIEATPPLYSEVMNGTLSCALCSRIYPIENTVPLFLPSAVLERRHVGTWPYNG